jgi:formylglycine-generating enzyme required for sulfatase activity
MGDTMKCAGRILAISTVVAACYSKPGTPEADTDAGDTSTGTMAMTMTSGDSLTLGETTAPTTTSSTTTTMTSASDTESDSDTDSDTTDPTDTTDPSETDTTDTAPPACDVLADDCAEGTLCDGQACVAPPDGMVAVPGGPFMMGCNDDVDGDCGDDEYPYHEVTLSSFAIDETEVTVGMWNECVDAGMCPSLPAVDWSRNVCSYASDDHPVTCIDWFQASAYCTWRGAALPTEAQWEKAARGTDGRIYPWGNEASSCTLAHTSDCAASSTIAVGSKPAGASPYGALDMTGNVAEWVGDWYAASYYVSSPDQDPQGPDDGTRRAARSSGPNYSAARTSSRSGGEFDVPTPEAFHVNVGVRCAFVPG